MQRPTFLFFFIFIFLCSAPHVPRYASSSHWASPPASNQGGFLTQVIGIIIMSGIGILRKKVIFFQQPELSIAFPNFSEQIYEFCGTWSSIFGPNFSRHINFSKGCSLTQVIFIIIVSGLIFEWWWWGRVLNCNCHGEDFINFSNDDWWQTLSDKDGLCCGE